MISMGSSRGRAPPRSVSKESPNIKQAAGDPDDGSTYYAHWLAPIERLAAEKGVASAAALSELRDAWDRAAHATPSGALGWHCAEGHKV